MIEIVLGILLGVMGVLLFRGGAPSFTVNENPDIKKIDSDIADNKAKIKEAKEELNVKKATEKKSLSDLLEYFKRIGK